MIFTTFVVMITETANYDLSSHNTFGMKVKCALYLEYDNASDLEKIDWESLPQPVMHIGGGSNLLFTGDFPGTVLHSKIKYIKYVDIGLDEIPVMVGAGTVFDDFVADTAKNGLWGAENLSLIPGEVGASAVQNIGAYGVEVKDIIKGVVCFDRQIRKSVKFTVAECEYGYRESMFKHAGGRYIITSVLFRLSRKAQPRLEYKGLATALGLTGGTMASKAEQAATGQQTATGQQAASPETLTPAAVRNAVIGIRRAKLPDPAVTGSAGSFFKNPVVDASTFAHIIDVARADAGQEATVPHFVLDNGFVKVPAAWMIEKCGMKGARLGGAAVYQNQPLVIVNASGNATPQEVLDLENKVIGAVREKFGVELHPEVEHI